MGCWPKARTGDPSWTFDPDVGDPGSGSLDSLHHHLYVCSAQGARDCLHRFDVHQAGVDECGGEHVPGDSGEALQVEDSVGHGDHLLVKPFTMRAAAIPAERPVSMFETVTPGATGRYGVGG
jgi:hypothetical protein